MKSRILRIILSILILSLTLQTITLPAHAQLEPNASQAEIENLVVLQEIEQPAYPDYRNAQPYPEDRFKTRPQNWQYDTDIPKPMNARMPFHQTPGLLQKLRHRWRILTVQP